MENNAEKVVNQTIQGIVRAKNNNKSLLFVFSFCFIVMLIFIGVIFFKTLNLMQVIEPNGNHLPTRLVRKEKLIEISLKNHTLKANQYTNNINRYTLKEYLARARFLISNKDLAFIYNTYKKNKYYDRAKEQGYEYKNEFIKFLVLDKKELPYHIKFLSKTTVYDGVNIIDSFFIEGEGDVTKTTPQFEENDNGFYFSNYSQKYIKDYDREN